MPVIECSCGMVMSLSVDGPRGCCIRCGRVEFHDLERGAAGRAQGLRSSDSPKASNALPAVVLAGIFVGDSGPPEPVASTYGI